MTTSFASLKKSRQSQFEKLTGELSKLNQGPQQNTNQEDTRFWKPEVDKAGNGYAVIRFLPAPADEDVPFVRIWDHGFQGPGGWYIEKSLTTLNQKDPVSEYNTTLWNNGTEAGKEQVRKQKRRLSFISNIYVVKDPAHPENEGKTFLYKYGKKIFDKLNDLMNPEFEDEKPVNPFDLWEGANFKLKIRQVEGYRNYDKSEFDSPSALMDDDEALEKLWKQEHSLQAFLDPKEFKSYDELKTRLYKALGLDGSAKVESKANDEGAPWDEPEEKFEKPVKAAQPAKAARVKMEEEDDDMEFFKKLVDDDE